MSELSKAVLESLKGKKLLVANSPVCYFCEQPCDLRANMLSCTHLVCKNCTSKEWIQGKIICPCFMMTKGRPTDYPIPLGKRECYGKNCESEPVILCTICRDIFCRPCALVHDANCHLPRSFIYSVAINCFKCQKDSAELLCLPCNSTLCSNCYLMTHTGHNFKIFIDIVTRLGLKIKEKKTPNEKLNDFIKQSMQPPPLPEKKVKPFELKELSSRHRSIKNRLQEKLLERKMKNLSIEKDDKINISDDVDNPGEAAASSGKSDVTLKVELLHECKICYEWTNRAMLIECVSCKRQYHNSCHIPPLPVKAGSTGEYVESEWHCTMCVDLNKYWELDEQENTVDENRDSCTLTNAFGQKALKRILMELYCALEDSDYYSNCFAFNARPASCVKMPNPLRIKFNGLRQQLENSEYKTTFVVPVCNLKMMIYQTLLHFKDDLFFLKINKLRHLMDDLIKLWTPKKDRKFIDSKEIENVFNNLVV